MVAIQRIPDEGLDVVRPLFKQVFGTPLSTALLRWKYASGRGESWGYREDGALLMHCGLWFRNVLWQGEMLRAAQLIDLMAAPKAGGLSRRNSPFTLLMQALLARLPGRDNPVGMAFGFPSARAMRLGEINGVYGSVGHWMELDFVARPFHQGAQASELTGISGRDETKIMRTWEAMRLDFASYALGMRDAAHLHWRYLAHPERRYRLLSVNSGWLRKTIGFVVLGPGDESCEIVDLIGRREDFPDMLRATQHWWWRYGGKGLVLMATAHFAPQLQPFADACHDTEFRIMANPMMPPEALTHLNNRWWLTGGDSDYR